MYFYFIIALQGFCIYHLIKNRNHYYWIFLIIFIPLIGSIIYIITQVYSKQDVEKVQSDLTSIINPTKKVKDLEKQLKFSETFQNKVNLADALVEIGDFANAVTHYENSLEGTFKNDFYVIQNLIVCYSKLENFEQVIAFAEKIKEHNEFKKSHTQFLYGLAFEEVEKFDEAETQLKQIDIRYSNYNERLVFAKFLIRRGKTSEAKEVLDEISMESQNMNKNTKRDYRSTFQEVETLLKEI